MRCAATILALLALSGCGGGGSGAAVPTVQVFGDAQELAAYRQIASDYAERTGRRVTLAETPDRDTHLAKLTTGFAAARAPDAFLLNYRNFGPFVSKGVLEPPGNRVPADAYYASARDAFTWEGTLTCLPQSASSVVVYLNLDLLERARVEAPATAWHYDEFLRSARRIRDAIPGERVRALGVDPSLIRLAPFVWISGGELVDELNAPKRFVFDTPGARRGIDRFLALHREDLTPTETDVEAKALSDRFLDGELAMYVSSRRETGIFRAIEDFAWDVAPFPRAEQEAGVLQSDGWCVSKGAEANAAWAFVRFAAGKDGQRILARDGRIVPALKAAAAGPGFLEAPPENARVFLDAAERLRRLPNTENWPRIEDAASLAFKRAYYVELSVDDAIARIEAETNGLF